MTTLEVLRKARALIRKGWHQGYFARDRRGEAVTYSSRAAVAWCASGACMRAGYVNSDEARAELRRHIRGGDIPRWNDSPERTKPQVLALFDKAIRRLSKPKRVRRAK